MNRVLPALFILVPAALLAASKPESLPQMTPELWRADVDFVARELPRRHKNAFHSMTGDQFATEVAALRAQAARGDDDQMIVGLMRIAALVGDGHTYLRLPSSVRQFPLTAVRIEGSLRIVRAAGEAADLVGGRLVAIDGIAVDEAEKRIRTILPQHESEELFVAFSPPYLTVPEVLHGLGITKSAAAARFTVVMDDGSERSAQVRSIDGAARPQWRTAAAVLPLYRQRQDEWFWFTPIEDGKAVYVCFRKYDDLRGKSRELWRFVDSHPVVKIVIDMRQNGGGDFNVGRKYLVDELAGRPKLRAYVVTSGRTFSAALKNAIDFRQIAHATLVGETIAERPNSYSENDEMRLPNSRLEMSYSTRYYEFLPNDDSLVKPDREIRPTWQEWVAGRDPVLEWIAAQR